MDWKELEQETSLNLIDYIRYKDQPDYRVLAEAAFAAFTFRFSKEIVDKCRKIAKNWGYDNEIADTIAERCFDRFWQYPFGFTKDNCGNLNIDKCIMLYLLKTAKNCFFDYRKEESGDSNSPYDGEETVIVEFPAIDHLSFPADSAEEMKQIYETIEKALSTLSLKHKTIYLTYKAYEKEGYKLPRSLLKTLREELDLSQNSIRVYKNEAFKTVFQHLKVYGKG